MHAPVSADDNDDDHSGADDEPAAKKRNRPKKSEEDKRALQFQRFTDLFVWLLKTPEAHEEYITRDRLHCAACKQPLVVTGKKSNLKQHEATTRLRATFVFLFRLHNTATRKRRRAWRRNRRWLRTS
jgi:hypothetical protein